MAIKSYKGMDKDMKCRGFQYEVGGECETDKAKACEVGFHACEMPLDVFNYYPPAESRFFEVEQDGDISREDVDSKVASTKLKVGAEIGIPGLVKAQIEYVKNRTNTEHTDSKQATAGYAGAATAGDRGAATAGYAGAATAGEYGAATAGDRGAATAGNRGAATARGSAAVGDNGCALARGRNVKAKGGLGAILVVCKEFADSYDIKEWKAVAVDGETIKPDTWYTLKDGEFVEVE